MCGTAWSRAACVPGLFGIGGCRGAGAPVIQLLIRLLQSQHQVALSIISNFAQCG